MKSSLFVLVNEGNGNDLGIENQFNEVCNPLEAGIGTGIPDVEPKNEIKSSCISIFGWTMTVDAPIQRPPSFDFVQRVWCNQITKFIKHRFLLHGTRTKSRTLRR